MKFPRLSDSELKSLETAFIEFLVVQGVDDATWRTLNQNEPQKALGLVDLFSQIVWKKILDETRYLVRKLEGELHQVKNRVEPIQSLYVDLGALGAKAAVAAEEEDEIEVDMAYPKEVSAAPPTAEERAKGAIIASAKKSFKLKKAALGGSGV